MSDPVINEIKKGNEQKAQQRILIAREFPVLGNEICAIELAIILLKKGMLPEKASLDALHIALASIHRIDYLLSWNCKHIANPITRPKIVNLINEMGLNCPLICTPSELIGE